MIIAQISDTHIALDSLDADQRIADFVRTIDHVNSLDPQPDVIVHTGDVVHNGRPEEYGRAASILAAARAPVYVLAGNKDDRANLRAAFAGPRCPVDGGAFVQYAVEDFPLRLVMLDTLSGAGNRGDFCPDRARQLEDMIAADPIKPIAVFAHHPPFEVLVGPDRIHFDDLGAMKRLDSLLQSTGRVVGLFCGHVHRPTTGLVGTVPATVVTSVATTLRKGDYPAAMHGRPVYLLHRFSPRGGFISETMVA